MKLKIIDIASHRNGICGAPFDVALFTYEGKTMVAVIFDQPFHCAVLDIEKLYRGNLRDNRWRGDAFEAPLRTLLKLS